MMKLTVLDSYFALLLCLHTLWFKLCVFAWFIVNLLFYCIYFFKYKCNAFHCIWKHVKPALFVNFETGSLFIKKLFSLFPVGSVIFYKALCFPLYLCDFWCIVSINTKWKVHTIRDDALPPFYISISPSSHCDSVDDKSIIMKYGASDSGGARNTWVAREQCHHTR